MDKKFVVLLIVLALIFLEVYFKFFSVFITGLLHEAVLYISLTIEGRSRMCLEFLDMPNTVVQYTTINVRVGLWNCGSIRLNETTVQLEVVYKGNQSITTEEKTFLNFSVDERREVIVPWHVTPDPALYTMYVRALYDNETSNEIAKNFTILPPPVIPPPYIPIGPGVAKIANISVGYPPRLNLTQDAEYLVLIKVENIGNLEIHNLTLDLESQYIEARVLYPKEVSILGVGESVIFTTNLKVPADLEPGNYSIYWFVSSDEVDKAGEIIGVVRILDIKEKAEELLAYYTALLERLENEINAKEEKGCNVTLARNAYKDAKTELEIAKELYRIGLYSGSIEQLGLVREKIIEAVRLLVLAECVPRVIVIPALPVIPCLIWVIIVIILNSVIILLTRKKLHWTKIVLIMVVVSFIIGLLSGLECLIWIIVTVLIMISILILIELRERWEREHVGLERFRRW